MADVVIEGTSPSTEQQGVLTSSMKSEWNKARISPAPLEEKPNTGGAEPSDTAKEPVSEAAAETEPETEAGESTQEQGTTQVAPKPDQHKGKGAQARINELVAKSKAAEEKSASLERELAELRKGKQDVKPEASSAPKVEAKPQTFEDWEKQFDPDTWLKKWSEENPDKSYERGIVALNNHVNGARDQFKQAEDRQTEQVRKISDRLAEGKNRYKDFDAVMPPTVQAIMADNEVDITVKALIGGSDVLPDLIYALGSDKEQFASFLTMAKKNPDKALRYIVLTESLVQEELSGKSETTDEATDQSKAPVKPVTRAKTPPAEVGGRGTGSEDPLEAEAQAHPGVLTAKAKAEMTRRALARLKQ